LGVAVLAVEVRRPGDIDAALAAISKERSGALLIAPDPTWFTGHSGRIAQFALKNRLPGISTTRTWADEGGLIAYGTNFHHSWRRAATYVDRILKGAQPADMPVEQPTTFELVINLKTAQTLGPTIPPSLLLRADELIE
jgi:putative ABC transport system substrate-binding protein